MFLVNACVCLRRTTIAVVLIRFFHCSLIVSLIDILEDLTESTVLPYPSPLLYLSSLPFPFLSSPHLPSSDLNSYVFPLLILTFMSTSPTSYPSHPLLVSCTPFMFGPLLLITYQAVCSTLRCHHTHPCLKQTLTGTAGRPLYQTSTVMKIVE